MKKVNTSAGRKAPTPKARPRRAIIQQIQQPVVIREVLRTGSGVRLLSVRHETETRHVKVWPNGRRELMPRTYTSAVLFNASVPMPRLRNNGLRIAARMEAAYRCIDQQMGFDRVVTREVAI